MKKSTKICLLPCAVLGFMIGNAFAQDIHFSQFYNAPLQINPANAGAFGGDQRVVINYRNQWKAPSLNSPFNTYVVGFDMPFFKKKWKNDNLGIGVFVYNDKAGDSKMGTTKLSVSLANHLTLYKNNKISVAIQGAYAQNSVSASSLQWGDISSSNPTSADPLAQNFSKGYADFAVGGLWTYSKKEGYSTANNSFKANFGVSYNHLTRPNVSYESGGEDMLFSKIMVHSNIHIGIPNTVMAVVPNVLYQKQGPSQEVLPGVLLRYSLVESSRYTGRKKETAVYVGGHYRFKDAFVATVLMEFASYAMGISYDVNTSDLRTASSFKGGFELSLRYINPNPFRSVSTARFD